MARVVEGFHGFTCTRMRLSTNGMNHTSLCRCHTGFGWIRPTAKVSKFVFTIYSLFIRHISKTDIRTKHGTHASYNYHHLLCECTTLPITLLIHFLSAEKNYSLYLLHINLPLQWSIHIAQFYCLLTFMLHRMHEMQTIVTDMRGVRRSVCLSRGSVNSASLWGGSFGAAFAKSLVQLIVEYSLN